MIGIEECLSEAMSIPGAVGAVLVDHTSGMPVAAEGVPDPVRAADGLGDVFRAVLDGIALASPEQAARVEDVIVTTDAGYHLIRPVETVVDGPLLLCLRLDGDRANLALARLRLRAVPGERAAR
ncbi:roadblock/LC7 domain-containing protein [Microbispora sp. RL4-1S]|uniref:Roadblock/LC7 domain-containing protein n=1 Tax=Microbispora oryzae TaxID=2806554 RepID=A0A941AHV0_9ACTN|nr:roadblock/LC7 domain-containing protein [Microbispora oryzae]MBP2703122.1 roadblock/LC7 domain-containing protein [Microbispora oryzae]